MAEEQIKHMVDRFLGWKLPANFSPDAGISFKAAYNEHTAHPMKHEPTGTNLFDAAQATEMVRHMIEGMPIGARANKKWQWLSNEGWIDIENASFDRITELLDSGYALRRAAR